MTPKTLSDLLFSDIDLDVITKIKEDEERMKALEDYHDQMLFQCKLFL